MIRLENRVWEIRTPASVSSGSETNDGSLAGGPGESD